MYVFTKMFGRTAGFKTLISICPFWKIGDFTCRS